MPSPPKEFPYRQPDDAPAAKPPSPSLPWRDVAAVLAIALALAGLGYWSGMVRVVAEWISGVSM